MVQKSKILSLSLFQSQGLTTALTSQILADIQRSIRQKDEEMSWLDACCLHFAIKGKTKTETYTFQTRDPNVKKEWIVGMSYCNGASL